MVLITNALCYSAADIFAAGFQDHKIGTVLGIDPSTGAGGAQVVLHSKLPELVKQDKDNPFAPLPHGFDLRFAIRRTLRVGANNKGEQLEDLGVQRNAFHPMTRGDLLNGNLDLIRKAVQCLHKAN